MKKNRTSTFFFFFMILVTGHLLGKTIAFSPSIPGQPLIFHKEKPALSPIEKMIVDRLSSHQVCKLKKLSKITRQISQELVSFIGIIFLPLSNDQQQHLTSIYLFNLNDNIHKITRIFLSSTENDSFSVLIEETLTRFVQITDQMLINSAITPDNVLFQANYLQMQQEVINPFKAALALIIKDSEKVSYLQANAKSAIVGLVSRISLYISNLNNVVTGDNPGSKSLVLVRQQIEENLVSLVESTYLLAILT